MSLVRKCSKCGTKLAVYDKDGLCNKCWWVEYNEREKMSKQQKMTKQQPSCGLEAIAPPQNLILSNYGQVIQPLNFVPYFPSIQMPISGTSSSGSLLQNTRQDECVTPTITPHNIRIDVTSDGNPVQNRPSTSENFGRVQNLPDIWCLNLDVSSFTLAEIRVELVYNIVGWKLMINCEHVSSEYGSVDSKRHCCNLPNNVAINTIRASLSEGGVLTVRGEKFKK